jgi:hypothetical protein
MANIKQIVNELKKSIGSFDLAKAIEQSDNEAKTRMYLVEPFFMMLRFNRGFENGNLVPEYDADFASLKGKKVDYAIVFKNKPEVIIEVKKAGMKLTEIHSRQLNEYFTNTNESKIGILTNGIEYQFYCRNNNGGVGLHPQPFFSFRLDAYESDSLIGLANFYATGIEIKTIIDEAQSIFFLEAFEAALFNELLDPSRDFIKAIHARMGGSRLKENTENQIKELINSVSLKAALDKLMVSEANSANTGIITTQEEINVFHVIQTILAHQKQIDANEIGYRDFKGKFSILLQDNLKKKVCDLYVTPTSKRLEIDGEKFDIPDIDSILKLKKKLIDRVLFLLQ